MNDDLLSLVRMYSQKIRNGRTIPYIFNSLCSEVDELDIEVNGSEQGEDGIFGESIDVILCALDLIFESNPAITNQEIVEYARKNVKNGWQNMVDILHKEYNVHMSNYIWSSCAQGQRYSLYADCSATCD